MNEQGNGLPDRGVYHGNSMSNVFVDGDILIFKDVPFDRLECGDIVAVFERTPYYVHRIVDKTSQHAVTMGDNNDRPDNLLLTRESHFLLVESVIPVGKPTDSVSPVAGGRSGMLEFRRHQRVRRISGRVIGLFRQIRWLGRCRLPARHQTKFRDGTIQWSFGSIPVAARNPSGKTFYLSAWKRFFFRIPKDAAAQPVSDDLGQVGDRKTNRQVKKGK